MEIPKHAKCEFFIIGPPLKSNCKLWHVFKQSVPTQKPTNMAEFEQLCKGWAQISPFIGTAAVAAKHSKTSYYFYRAITF